MKKFKALVLLCGACTGFCYADGSQEMTPTTVIDHQSAKFSITPNSPLTEALVDNCWASRENENNQKIIAEYLLTTPQVPHDYITAWKVARLVSFIGNYGVGEARFVKKSDGVPLFKYGASAGELAMSLNPHGVEGYYWYAADLGSYGLARGILSSVSKAGSGMKALKMAMQIDPGYDWYGSSRILGKYYQELPAMFGGSKDKALAMFKASVDHSPDYRNNWVFLGQYYLKVGEDKSALAACSEALTKHNLNGTFEEERYMHEANECVAKAKSS